MSDVVLVVRSAVAPLAAEPRASSEQASQVTAGHVVERLEAREPWYRVRTPDGYEGWMHRGYLMALDAAAHARRFSAARVSLGCVVRGEDGIRRAFPLGAKIERGARVESGEALGAEDIASRFPRTARAAAGTAREMFAGTPYQWGGVTPWGADCSGMVQAVFGFHGIALPRDARDQALEGAPIDAALESLDAGDLAFFSDRADGPITHVALALGAERLVHLAIGRGGYAVETLDAPDEYARTLMARFRCARRVR